MGGNRDGSPTLHSPKRSRVDFETLVERSPAGVYMLDRGRFVYANARVAEIFGQSNAEAVIGHAFIDYVAPEDRTRLQAIIEQAQDGNAGTQAAEFESLGGPAGPLRLGTHFWARNPPAAGALCGMLQDISEKRRMALEIERQESRVRTALLQTIDVVMGLGNLRDPYTVGHERRVGDIARVIGERLGMDEASQEGLRIAGRPQI